MITTNISIQRALDSNSLREPVFRSVIQSLRLPVGSHGLDAGCGLGLQACTLAEAVGLNGKITGIDIDADLAFRNALGTAAARLPSTGGSVS